MKSAAFRVKNNEEEYLCSEQNLTTAGNITEEW